MKTFMVSYDLIKRKNYPELLDALRAYGYYWHYLGSTWFIKSNQTCAQIRDSLLAHIDSDDKLIVCLVQRDAAWTDSFGEECSKWLMDNL